jgi:hypothetical protein
MTIKLFLAAIIGLVLIVVAVVIRRGLVGSDRFAFARDIEPGLTYLRTIIEAEERCYGNTHHYVPIGQLSNQGCGGLDDAALRQPHNGFALEVFGQGSQFWIRLTPASLKGRREISLYTDQSGVVRWASGQRSATSSSDILTKLATSSIQH